MVFFEGRNTLIASVTNSNADASSFSTLTTLALLVLKSSASSSLYMSPCTPNNFKITLSTALFSAIAYG